MTPVPILLLPERARWNVLVRRPQWDATRCHSKGEKQASLEWIYLIQG